VYLKTLKIAQDARIKHVHKERALSSQLLDIFII